MSTIRTHVNVDGTPKRIFVTEDEAVTERDARCPAKDVYPCTVGAGPRHWHIGGSRRIAQIRQTLKETGL